MNNNFSNQNDNNIKNNVEQNSSTITYTKEEIKKMNDDFFSSTSPINNIIDNNTITSNKLTSSDNINGELNNNLGASEIPISNQEIDHNTSQSITSNINNQIERESSNEKETLSSIYQTPIDFEMNNNEIISKYANETNISIDGKKIETMANEEENINPLKDISKNSININSNFNEISFANEIASSNDNNLTTNLDDTPNQNIIENSNIEKAKTIKETSEISKEITEDNDNITTNNIQLNNEESVTFSIDNTSTSTNTATAISTGTYILYNILFSIPIIGLIFVFVKAFDKKNINLRNYARSYLVNMIIMFILIFLPILIVLTTSLSYEEQQSNTPEINTTNIEEQKESGYSLDDDITNNTETLDDSIDTATDTIDDEITNDTTDSDINDNIN